MPLIAIQCKNCGGALQVDSEATSYYCPFCQTPYVMEQAIYQTFQTTNIGHIENANIIDDGSGKIDQQINSGEALLQLRKFREARETFLSLTCLYAHKYRAWWGLARAMTENFTKAPDGKDDFECVSDALQSAIQLAPANEKRNIETAQASYIPKWERYCNQLMAERSQKLQAIDARVEQLIAPLQEKEEDLREKIVKKRVSMRRMKKISTIVPYVGFAALGLLQYVTSHNDNLIASVLAAALVGALFMFLPLKLIFFFVNKASQMSGKLVINNSHKQLEQVANEMYKHRAQFDGYTQKVIAETSWLDR